MAKTLSIILGVILVLFGFLGFISNPLVGSNALFAADGAHNLIRLILGAILLIVAFWSSEDAVLWLKIIGVVVFVLGFIGIFTVSAGGGMLLGIAYTNGASDWFNLIAGAVLCIAGMYGREGKEEGIPPMQSPDRPGSM